MNVWTAWRVGMRTKTGGDGSFRAVMRQLAQNIRNPERFSWTLRPMDFLRFREFDFALRAISDLPAPQRVLDISSPKLFPLTLASEFDQSQVFATDVLDTEVNWVRGKSELLGLSNLKCQVEDARRLKYPSDHFDLVTSISVIEHIAPEDGGDIPAIQEIYRVLRPGGFAVVTVPASRQYFADYQIGHVYERLSAGKPIFFQRFYTPDLLQRNFVNLGRLEMLSLKFVEELYYFDDPRKRIAHWFNCSPMQNMIFGPLFPLMSHVFLSHPKPFERCRKPYIACMVLQKPRAAMRMAA